MPVNVIHVIGGLNLKSSVRLFVLSGAAVQKRSLTSDGDGDGMAHNASNTTLVRFCEDQI